MHLEEIMTHAQIDVRKAVWQYRGGCDIEGHGTKVDLDVINIHTGADSESPDIAIMKQNIEKETKGV